MRAQFVKLFLFCKSCSLSCSLVQELAVISCLSLHQHKTMASILGVYPQRRFKHMYSDYTASLRSLESFNKEIGLRQYWPKVRTLFTVLVVTVVSLFCTSTLGFCGSAILLRRANDLGRQCLDVQNNPARHPQLFKFAMVTFSDGSTTIPGRSFEGLMELVTPNKKSYVARHGYDFIDASDMLDKDRPPSWSKILAVKQQLPHYDWVFWNDADSAVTNPAIKLEDIIYSVVGDANFEDMPDFILTKDVTGVNAGMFFFRNSEWSQQFLELWWNQATFVQPFGQSKSGDNTALKYLISIMPKDEFKQHVRIPKMQCLFNSNLWRPSWRSCHRLITLTRLVWQGVYSKGDFMVHLAGLNDKKTWMKNVLRDLKYETSVERLQPNRRTVTNRIESFPVRQQ